MNKLPIWLLAVLSSFLLTIGWPPLNTAFLLFVGFVPLFFIHHKLSAHKNKHFLFWGWSYIIIFLFNLGTTWWVWHASQSGAIIMLFANSLVLSLPFLLFSFTNEKLPKLGYKSFVIFYLMIEFLHFNWSASWPWLTLGNGLACFPSFIQWYEFTGEMGGTLLILVINIIIFKALFYKKYIQLIQPFGYIVLAFISSYFIVKFNKTGNEKSLECVISQPQIDPYTEKFTNGENYLDAEEQMNIAIEQAQPLLTRNTAILLLPETAVVGNNEINQLENNSTINLLRPILESYKNLNIIAGAETYEIYKSEKQPSPTARPTEQKNFWYDNYNTALLIKNNSKIDWYHKSRLVPGVEKMPFPILEKLSINLGGSSGSLGASPKAKNFTLNNGIKIAPLICYESVFGDYTTEFVKDGAQILAVITNDGWWKETPGYKQHLLFGAIRCIETRRQMIRSANVGVSAKIDQFGNISQATKYKDRVAFKCQVTPLQKQTVYVKYGNIIGKMSVFVGITILLGAIIKQMTRKNNL